MPDTLRINAPPATGFTLTWEGPADPDDGEPRDFHFLGAWAHGPTAIEALLAFAATAHADWHGGALVVRDERGELVFGARLPLAVGLEIRG